MFYEVAKVLKSIDLLMEIMDYYVDEMTGILFKTKKMDSINLKKFKKTQKTQKTKRVFIFFADYHQVLKNILKRNSFFSPIWLNGFYILDLTNS